jgi:hypothetical protein
MMTDAELQFLRDEILKVVVASIAEAKAEVLSSANARIAGLALQVAGSNTAAVEIGCAIVAALADRGSVDPSRVAIWARWMAHNQPATTDETVRTAAANTLTGFASLLAAMAASPIVATVEGTKTRQ